MNDFLYLMQEVGSGDEIFVECRRFTTIRQRRIQRRNPMQIDFSIIDEMGPALEEMVERAQQTAEAMGELARLARENERVILATFPMTKRELTPFQIEAINAPQGEE